MTNTKFPPLQGEAWIETREALHAYAKLLGKYRAAISPKQKHWWHVGLLPSLNGLSSGLLHLQDETFSIELNLMTSSIDMSFLNASEVKIPLTGQSTQSLHEDMHKKLAYLNIENIDQSVLTNTEFSGFDISQVAEFARAIHQLDTAFEIFKSEQRRETGPITLWAHHFDLALLWFSGRLVEGVDPADEENADEQVNFGFSVGDESTPEPYFYITAYPNPAGLESVQLPDGASWHNEGWNGALLPYSVLTEVKNPQSHLLDFWRAFLLKAQQLMV
jgi:hypothetical protein